MRKSTRKLIYQGSSLCDLTRNFVSLTLPKRKWVPEIEEKEKVTKTSKTERNYEPNNALFQDNGILWPNFSLDFLSWPKDPRFLLPGNSGITLTAPIVSQPQNKLHTTIEYAQKEEKLGELLCTHQKQIEILNSAHDYIHYFKDSNLCTGLLTSFPSFQKPENCLWTLHETPKVLNKKLTSLFRYPIPPSSVIILSQRTASDMSNWSESMESEREKLSESFILSAKELCAQIYKEGFWADFIDPFSGRPYFSKTSTYSLSETDETFSSFGFLIQDEGCCKIISHPKFGKNVFVGLLVTTAHKSQSFLVELFDKSNLN